MTSVPSATTWGSPTATKHAFLIHGLTASSHTWHRVASTLAEQGYHVIAPNLLGHVSRTTSDYHVRAMADDLRPYLAAHTYDIVMGHSLGCVVALHLLPHLPQKLTSIVLVDPPLNLAPAQLDGFAHASADACTRIQNAEWHCKQNPLWTTDDGVYTELGKRLCAPETVRGVLTQNRPWNYLSLLGDVSDEWKMSVLIADPALFKVCSEQELVPYKHVRHVVVFGAGHCIQAEFPEVIVEAALERLAELEKTPTCSCCLA